MTALSQIGIIFDKPRFYTTSTCSMKSGITLINSAPEYARLEQLTVDSADDKDGPQMAGLPILYIITWLWYMV